LPKIFAGAPNQASEGNVLRQRCDARGFQRSTIEIIARRRVAPAFEATEGERRKGPPPLGRVMVGGLAVCQKYLLNAGQRRAWGKAAVCAKETAGVDVDLAPNCRSRPLWRSREIHRECPPAGSLLRRRFRRGRGGRGFRDRLADSGARRADLRNSASSAWARRQRLGECELSVKSSAKVQRIQNAGFHWRR
jgi:hypothetical protein